jgi:hypothetical protein
LIVPTFKDGASSKPDELLPIKPLEYLINAKYSSGFTDVKNENWFSSV